MERLEMRYPVKADPFFAVLKYREDRSHKNVSELPCMKGIVSDVKASNLCSIINSLDKEVPLDDLLILLDNINDPDCNYHQLIQTMAKKEAESYAFGAEYLMTMHKNEVVWSIDDFAAVIRLFCNLGLYESAGRMIKVMVNKIPLDVCRSCDRYDFTEPLLFAFEDTVTNVGICKEDPMYYSSPGTTDSEEEMMDMDDSSIAYDFQEEPQGALKKPDPLASSTIPLNEDIEDAEMETTESNFNYRGATKEIRDLLCDHFVTNYLEKSARKSLEELKESLKVLPPRAGNRNQIADMLVLYGHDFGGSFMLGSWKKYVWKPVGKSYESPFIHHKRTRKGITGVNEPSYKRQMNKDTYSCR